MKPDHCRQNGPVVTETDVVRCGVVVTIVDMSLNSIPPTINPMELERRLTTGQGEAVVDYAYWSSLANSNLADPATLHDAGVVGSTAFVTYAVDFPPVGDDLNHAWMASCCLHWFTAMDKEPAHCLYDMDVGRDPPGALP
ncbi:MAG: hypothetical protein OXG36_12300 [Caldilineaceae bacterium]|nr:hypothetical protein [Caldilineaceae bacterium]